MARECRGNALRTPTRTDYTVEADGRDGSAPGDGESQDKHDVRSLGYLRWLSAQAPGDFRERLLPFRLSPLGPGLAWADVDRDGDGDLYVCGTSEQPGALFRNHRGGLFRRVTDAGFTAGTDEGSALFFEANGDGLPDLYVVSGGGASEADSPALGPAYLNDGVGRFRLALDGRFLLWGTAAAWRWRGLGPGRRLTCSWAAARFRAGIRFHRPAGC
jgi:hypothetical protein